MRPEPSSPSRRRPWVASIGLVALSACGGGGGGGGGGTTHVVTTLLDAGPGSLRAALSVAEDGDRIVFEVGLVGAIAVTSGTLEVTADVAIEGPGAALLAVEGQGAFRVFTVPEGVRARIQSLMVSNSGPTTGGGIEVNLGALTLEDVVIDRCVVPDFGRGGGVRVVAGSLVARRTRVRRCAAYNGGGLACDDAGTMRLESCTVDDNDTTGNSGAGVLVSHSTATLVNCTISGNATTGSDRVGGGIAVFASSGGDATCRVASCSIVNNAAIGVGGGLYLATSGAGQARLELRNSVVAFNTAPGGSPDQHGTGAGVVVTSFGRNVVRIGTGSGLTDGFLGDQVGTGASPLDPGVLPLSETSLTILTHPLLATSVALDAVPTASCVDPDGGTVAADQRGRTRPAGSACDAGAHERQGDDP